MQGRIISKEEFEKVKMLLEKGLSATEIYQNKLVDLSLPSIYRIKKAESFGKGKCSTEKERKYDELIGILFDCSIVDERNSNELFIPNIRVREALKKLENERYNNRLYELNEKPMWFNKESKKLEYK